jgi:hypothetical protein
MSAEGFLFISSLLCSGIAGFLKGRTDRRSIRKAFRNDKPLPSGYGFSFFVLLLGCAEALVAYLVTRSLSLSLGLFVMNLLLTPVAFSIGMNSIGKKR